MGFNVGDEVVCRHGDRLALAVDAVITGRHYTISCVDPGGTFVKLQGGVPGVWWGAYRFTLHVAAMPPPQGAAGTPQAPPETEADVPDIQGFEFLEEIEPPKELTPEEKLIEYRRSLKKILGNF